MWLAFFLAVGAPAQDDARAEMLFRTMETTLDKATVLDLAFETVHGEASLRAGQRLTGTLVAMTGNKLRLEVKGGKKNETVHLRIADGKRGVLFVEGDSGGTNRLRISPKRLDANMRTVLARSGVLLSLLPIILLGEEKDYKTLFRVSDFKLGPKEKIGTRETQRVDYALSPKGEKNTYPVTLWIDAKTGLPVKRLVMDAGFPWFTETYQLTLDGKADPKTFELPR